MDNLDSPLINNKNKNFSQLYEELVIKNQRLKKKNDHYQRLNPDELDYEMLAEIKGEN